MSVRSLHSAAGPLFGLSEPSAANEMGAWMTVTPFSRQVAATLAALASMPVAAMESLTAPWSLPPSVVNLCEGARSAMADRRRRATDKEPVDIPSSWPRRRRDSSADVPARGRGGAATRRADR